LENNRVIVVDSHGHCRLGCIRLVRDSAGRRIAVVNAFGIIYGILLVVAIVVFLDWWGRRKERHARNRAV